MTPTGLSFLSMIFGQFDGPLSVALQVFLPGGWWGDLMYVVAPPHVPHTRVSPNPFIMYSDGAGPPFRYSVGSSQRFSPSDI